MQGPLSASWFAGALAAVATREELLLDLIASDEYAQNGCFVFQFFKHGAWHRVAVDTCLPATTAAAAGVEAAAEEGSRAEVLAGLSLAGSQVRPVAGITPCTQAARCSVVDCCSQRGSGIWQVHAAACLPFGAAAHRLHSRPCTHCCLTLCCRACGRPCWRRPMPSCMAATTPSQQQQLAGRSQRMHTAPQQTWTSYCTQTRGRQQPQGSSRATQQQQQQGRA